jgi:hypothetical protein
MERNRVPTACIEFTAFYNCVNLADILEPDAFAFTKFYLETHEGVEIIHPYNQYENPGTDCIKMVALIHIRTIA